MKENRAISLKQEVMYKDTSGSSRNSESFLRTHKAILSRLRMLRRYKGDPENPNIMHLAITDKCNMSCPFCLYKKDNKNYKLLGVKKAESLIEDIDSPIVLISGGEPLLGNEILETTRRITRICRERGKITCILTNGVTLKRIVAKDYPEFSPGSKFMFQISIDGLKDVHDSLRGHFDLIIDNIQYARQAGHLVYTNTVVGNSNIGTLKETVEFISGFSNRIYLNPMVNSGNDLSKVELKKLGDFIINNQNIMIGNSVNFGKFLKGERALKCMFHSLISVTPTGKIKFPCYCFDEGAEYVDSFQEYLEKVGEKKTFFEEKSSAQCRSCYTHCLHEADVYAHHYLNEILEQIKRPVCVYRKYIAPLFSRIIS
jgi:sulfatase maturation enzyme AslB (radical SAM superfamily)